LTTVTQYVSKSEHPTSSLLYRV